MDIFEQAKAHADEIAPPPVDKPIAAAAVAFGFGLLVVGIYFALRGLGLSDWLAWPGSALVYGLIAYGDCVLGWRRHRQVFHDALADLKVQSGSGSVH